MFITSKRGAKDNIVTYEHICDTTEDLQKIDPHYITLGSTCIVVQGENGGIDAYIATSDKQWVPLGGGSGGSSEEDTKKYENSDIRFIDYDGKVVGGYTTEEFLQLNKMPKNPNHKNDKIPLTAQGWNWSLADIKAYMTKYPDAVMTIGQMYIPTDGKTHMILDVGVRKTIPLMIQQTISEGVTINWGDGSVEETIEGTGTVTTSHTYEAEGEYEIALEVADGCTLDFGGTVDETACNVFGESSARTYTSTLKKIFIGIRVISIRQQAFCGCYTLDTLTIPHGITSLGDYAFMACYNLQNLTLPNSIISCGQRAFRYCNALNNLALSNGITSIGQELFNFCYSINSIAIPDSVTNIGATAFGNCVQIVSLTIPDSVTSIGQQAFAACYNLRELTIPDGVTSIAQYTFVNCNTLTKLTIPETIISIGQQAFGTCEKLYSLIILAETPPTLANVNAFANMPSDCTIYVPHGKGDTYKAASGWSKWASQIQELPE